jgi:WD40 repeat protein
VTANNRILSAASDETLRLWHPGAENSATHCIITSRAFGIKAIAITADGRRAITGSEDHTLGVWDLEQGRLQGVLEGHTDCVTSVAVTADGRRVISGSDDHNLKIWDPDRATKKKVIGDRPGFTLRSAQRLSCALWRQPTIDTRHVTHYAVMHDQDVRGSAHAGFVYDRESQTLSGRCRQTSGSEA